MGRNNAKTRGAMLIKEGVVEMLSMNDVQVDHHQRWSSLFAPTNQGKR